MSENSPRSRTTWPPTVPRSRSIWLAVLCLVCASPGCRSKKNVGGQSLGPGALSDSGGGTPFRKAPERTEGPAARNRSSTCFSPPVRILPLGDSITQGRFDLRSYRYALFIKLTDAGIRFDFVGSMRTNHRGSPVWPSHQGKPFDPDHEGHWGFKADEVLASLPRWLGRYTPDVVLLHLGTNDALRGESTESTVLDLRRIIQVLRRVNPDVVVLAAELIPINHAQNARIEELNRHIRSLASRITTTRSPVQVVDQHTGFEPEIDLHPDRIHPSRKGEEKMAAKWFKAIRNLLHRRPVCPPATPIPSPK